MGGMGGMGNMTPEMIEQMYSNPMVQQMMEQMFSNPEVLRSMIESNPMLQQQLTPQMREMLANPEFLRMATNPEFMRAAAQMQAAMRRAQGGDSNSGGSGGGIYNPWASSPSQQTGTGTGNNDGGANQQPAFNPFAAFMNPGGSPQQTGGQAASPPINQAPPEERFQTQLQQLNDMGFWNAAMNIRALTMTGGNVEAAIEYLLNNPGN
ncbi:hypothetical protein GGI07_000387 [Coemansia sp. Benny D115]|nr:hypothetical protein GGI07_000387 [Coemansia sp. Benny D115]